MVAQRVALNAAPRGRGGKDGPFDNRRALHGTVHIDAFHGPVAFGSNATDPRGDANDCPAVAAGDAR